MEKRKTIHVNKNKRPRKRKLVGHEAWLADMKGKDIVAEGKGLRFIGRLVDFDKYTLTILDRVTPFPPEAMQYADEPYIVFKHSLNKIRKATPGEV